MDLSNLHDEKQRLSKMFWGEIFEDLKSQIREKVPNEILEKAYILKFLSGAACSFDPLFLFHLFEPKILHASQFKKKYKTLKREFGLD